MAGDCDDDHGSAGARRCVFDPLAHTDLPLISRTGRVTPTADGGFVLPSHGAAMPIVSDHRTLGHLVLRPRAGDHVAVGRAAGRGCSRGPSDDRTDVHRPRNGPEFIPERKDCQWLTWESDDSSEWVGWGTAGGAIAIGLGGLLVTVRDRIGNTNVALVLVVVIVIAASLGGRRAGLVTAAAACLSFNFFHSQPHYTLRVHSDNDIWTIGLLFVIGLVVGAGFSFRPSPPESIDHRTQRSEASRGGQRDGGRKSATDEVWPAVHAALVDELGLVGRDIRDRWPTASTSISQLDRNGRFDNKVMFWSRARGWSFLVTASPYPWTRAIRSYGRIVLTPSHGHGTTPDQRRVAVALADLLAITCERHQPSTTEPLSDADIPASRWSWQLEAETGAGIGDEVSGCGGFGFELVANVCHVHPQQVRCQGRRSVPTRR